MLVQLANYLRSQGVKKGDAVAIYMPMLAELPIAMLACARIGAVHSVSQCSMLKIMPYVWMGALFESSVCAGCVCRIFG